jgi:hypothetical protein
MQPLDFIGIIKILEYEGSIALGLKNVPDQQWQPDKDHARFILQYLQVLQQKTEGNRTDEESSILKTTLEHLHQQFHSLYSTTK